MAGGDEVFDKPEVGKQVVTLESKLVDVYNALFIVGFDNINSNVMIGKFSFSEKTKTELLRVVGLLSQYTDINAGSEG